MRILAIDPGFERLGLAVLEKKDGAETVCYSECFTTSPKKPFAERLRLVGEKMASVIKEWAPEALSIEKLYLAVNQKTAMGVAEARGVIVYEAAKTGLAIHEFTPLEIKVAVTGYGKADKKQMMFMVRKLTGLSEKKTSDDELDAVAAGLTCFACLPARRAHRRSK